VNKKRKITTGYVVMVTLEIQSRCHQFTVYSLQIYFRINISDMETQRAYNTDYRNRIIYILWVTYPAGDMLGPCCTKRDTTHKG